MPPQRTQAIFRGWDSRDMAESKSPDAIQYTTCHDGEIKNVVSSSLPPIQNFGQYNLGELLYSIEDTRTLDSLRKSLRSNCDPIGLSHEEITYLLSIQNAVVTATSPVRTTGKSMGGPSIFPWPKPGMSWRSQGYNHHISSAGKETAVQDQTKDKPTGASKKLRISGSRKGVSRLRIRGLQNIPENFTEMNARSLIPILEANRVKTRIARSAIHNWGIYASENIMPYQPVAEYIGEKIRSSTVDYRERSYIRNGELSFYFFFLGVDKNSSETMVLDATKLGGAARLINHSCTPNCVTRTITIDGENRIFIFSKSYIKIGEELTYDYMVMSEPGDAKTKCLCGSSNCKGYL